VFAMRAVLVRALGRLGRFDEAAAALAEFERRAMAAPHDSTPQQLASARAGLHVARSEFDQAAEALREAIDRLDPDDAGAVARRDALRVDLISALTFAGHDAEARAEGARLIDEASARSEDSELLIALTRVALARAQGEDHAAAQALLLQARPVIAAALGESHSRHLQLSNELFGVAFRRGDWPQALEYAQQVHERIRAKFGDENAVTWVTLVNWARTLSEAGRPDEAAEPARRAYERLVALAGGDAPQAQDANFVLALVELQRGDHAAAASLIDSLDADVLESGRATGQWPAAIDALRGIERQQAGDVAEARTKLDAALQAMHEEAGLEVPSLTYRLASQARARLD
jgi:tetratricopeptide (TPR) repeat protein